MLEPGGFTRPSGAAHVAILDTMKLTTLMPNLTMVELGTVRVYFSYATIVAFYTPRTGLTVSTNYWSTTTGKHLNHIDGGKKHTRLNAAEFQRSLTTFVLSPLEGVPVN